MELRLLISVDSRIPSVLPGNSSLSLTTLTAIDLNGTRETSFKLAEAEKTA
jgi:hypothetical protein